MRTILFILAIVLVVLLLFAGAFYFSQQQDDQIVSNDDTPIVDTTPNESNQQSITAKHQFRNGTHTVAGEIELPTPCHLLEHEIIVRESFPEQVTIGFTSRADDAELCAQVITPHRFMVSFEASKNALITATLNGEPAVLSLVKVREDEDLEDFEVFIKG